VNETDKERWTRRCRTSSFERKAKKNGCKAAQEEEFNSKTNTDFVLVVVVAGCCFNGKLTCPKATTMIPSSASVNIPRHGSIQGLTSGSWNSGGAVVMSGGGGNSENQSVHARLYPYLHYHPHYHQHHTHQIQSTAQYVHHLLGGDDVDIEDPSSLLLPLDHDHRPQHEQQLQQQQQHQQQHRESTQITATR
jgi:hypothetical protein